MVDCDLLVLHPHTGGDFLFTGLEVEAFEDLGVHFHDLPAGKAHFFVGVGVVAVEGHGLFDCLVDDDGQTGLVGVAKLLIESANDRFGALDQVVVFQDQVAGRGMSVQIAERVTIPVFAQFHDLVDVMIAGFRVGELTAGVVDPRNGGWKHVKRIASQINDADIGEKFNQRFDLCTEGWILRHKIFLTRGIHVPLDHGPVKGHDAALVSRGERLIELLVVWHFVHEGEEECDEVAVPDQQVNILIFFRLEK